MLADSIKTVEAFTAYISENVGKTKMSPTDLRIGDLAFIPSPVSIHGRKPTIAICLDNFHLGMNRFIVCMSLTENPKTLTVFHTSCGFKYVQCTYSACENSITLNSTAPNSCLSCMHDIEYKILGKSLHYCSKLYDLTNIPFSMSTICSCYTPNNTEQSFDWEEYIKTRPTPMNTQLKATIYFKGGFARIKSEEFDIKNKKKKVLKGNKVLISSAVITKVNPKTKMAICYNDYISIDNIMADVKKLVQ